MSLGSHSMTLLDILYNLDTCAIYQRMVYMLSCDKSQGPYVRPPAKSKSVHLMQTLSSSATSHARIRRNDHDVPAS